MLTAFIVAALIGYALGSIPFGIVLTRVAGAGDLRAVGSGNIGATNVLRTGRKGLAVGTLLLDALKGTLAVVLSVGVLHEPNPIVATAASDILVDPIARRTEMIAAVAAVAAMIGHCFPVWLGFRGGKGVATYLGALLPLFWPGAIAFAAIWLSTAYMTRYSSLSALVAVAIVPLLALILGEVVAALALLLMALLVFYRHGDNIRRLRDGTESRIGSSA